jgi:16S rRNA (uracil1498-N3)-methyltransferase
MANHRFQAPNIPSPGKEIELAEQEAKHIRDSLRLAVGSKVELFDGEHIAEAVLTMVGKRGVQARVEGLRPAAGGPVELTLYAALIKPNHWEILISKATELKVAKIIPVVTEYSQFSKDVGEKKWQRWERIISEACKQAEVEKVPALLRPALFEELEKVQGVKIACTLPRQAGQDIPLLKDTLPSSPTALNLLIGPEGGLSAKEHQNLQAWGWELASLGDFVLRAETAAIAALSIVQHHYSS